MKCNENNSLLFFFHKKFEVLNHILSSLHDLWRCKSINQQKHFYMHDRANVPMSKHISDVSHHFHFFWHFTYIVCVFKLSFLLKDFPHRLHVNGFSPVWILTWFFKAELLAHTFLHTLQTCPETTYNCLSSSYNKHHGTMKKCSPQLESIVKIHDINIDEGSDSKHG